MQITLDKLQPIRADLLRLDTSWQEWSFAQLVQALREWTIRNPLINQEPRRDQPSRKGKLLQINQHRQKCAYCNANNHSSGCNKITTIDERKKILKINYAITVRENITVLLNVEVKYLTITAINVTTYHFATRKWRTCQNSSSSILLSLC